MSSFGLISRGDGVESNNGDIDILKKQAGEVFLFQGLKVHLVVNQHLCRYLPDGAALLLVFSLCEPMVVVLRLPHLSLVVAGSTNVVVYKQLVLSTL